MLLINITSRGNEQKAIFKSVRDREKFLEYLESASERYNAVIHTFCLMDNHYNYIGKKKPPEWLNIKFILGYFGKTLSTSQKGYRAFVNTLIGRRYESPLNEVESSTMLGSRDFIGFIKDKYISGRKEDKDLPALKTLEVRITMEDVEKQVDSVLEYKNRISRNIKIYLSHRHTGEKLEDIGRYFNIGSSAVCQAGRRIAEKIEQDQKLKKMIQKIDGNLSRMKVCPPSL